MNDSELDQLLRAVDTPLVVPASFQRDVWNRIGMEEANGWKFHLSQIMVRFFGFFALPPVAVASCAAMAVAGMWIGSVSERSAPSDEVAYIQSISPFAQSHL